MTRATKNHTSDAAEIKQLQAAWAKTRASWHRTEKSLQSLMIANTDMFETLGHVGASKARAALNRLEKAVGKLDENRLKAHRNFNALLHTAGAPRKPAAHKANSAG